MNKVKIEFQSQCLKNELDEFLEEGGFDHVKNKIQDMRSDIAKIEDFLLTILHEEVRVYDDLSCVYWNTIQRKIIFQEVDIEEKVLISKPILECTDLVILQNRNSIEQLWKDCLNLLKSKIRE